MAIPTSANQLMGQLRKMDDEEQKRYLDELRYLNSINMQTQLAAQGAPMADRILDSKIKDYQQKASDGEFNTETRTSEADYRSAYDNGAGDMSPAEAQKAAAESSQRIKDAGTPYTYTNQWHSWKAYSTARRADTKWFGGPEPTYGEWLAHIADIGITDSELAEQMYDQLDQLKNTPGSTFFNPYGKGSTIQGAKEFFRVDSFDSDWIAQNRSLLQYLRIDDATGNVLQPGKNASLEDQAAYWYHQVAGQQELTEQAKDEWSSMQKEIKWYVDAGYSDAEITQRLAEGASNYKTLNALYGQAQKGTAAQLTEGIGYSPEAIRGVIWMTRNGQAVGDPARDYTVEIARYYRGLDRERAAAMNPVNDPTSDEYNPYIRATSDVLKELGLQSADDGTDEYMKQYKGTRAYEQYYKDSQNTKLAEEERSLLLAQADRIIASAANPDAAANELYRLLLEGYQKWDINTGSNVTHRFSTLAKMDEQRNMGHALGLTRPVDYRAEDVEAYVREGVEKRLLIEKAAQGDEVAVDSIRRKEAERYDPNDATQKSAVYGKSPIGQYADAVDSAGMLSGDPSQKSWIRQLFERVKDTAFRAWDGLWGSQEAPDDSEWPTNAQGVPPESGVPMDFHEGKDKGSVKGSAGLSPTPGPTSGPTPGPTPGPMPGPTPGPTPGPRGGQTGAPGATAPESTPPDSTRTIGSGSRRSFELDQDRYDKALELFRGQDESGLKAYLKDMSDEDLDNLDSSLAVFVEQEKKDRVVSGDLQSAAMDARRVQAVVDMLDAQGKTQEANEIVRSMQQLQPTDAEGWRKLREQVNPSYGEGIRRALEAGDNKGAALLEAQALRAYDEVTGEQTLVLYQTLAQISPEDIRKDPELLASVQEIEAALSKAIFLLQYTKDTEGLRSGFEEFVDNVIFDGKLRELQDNQGIGFWQAAAYAGGLGANQFYEGYMKTARWAYGKWHSLFEWIPGMPEFEASWAGKSMDAAIGMMEKQNEAAYQYLHENATPLELVGVKTGSGIVNTAGGMMVGTAAASGAMGAVHQGPKLLQEAAALESFLNFFKMAGYTIPSGGEAAYESEKRGENVLTQISLAGISGSITHFTEKISLGTLIDGILDGTKGNIYKALTQQGKSVLARWGKGAWELLKQMALGGPREGLQENTESVLKDVATYFLAGVDPVQGDWAEYGRKRLNEFFYSMLSGMFMQAASLPSESESARVVNQQLQTGGTATPKFLYLFARASAEDLKNPEIMEKAQEIKKQQAVEIATGEKIANGALDAAVDPQAEAQRQELSQDLDKAKAGLEEVSARAQKASAAAQKAFDEFMSNPNDADAQKRYSESMRLANDLSRQKTDQEAGVAGLETQIAEMDARRKEALDAKLEQVRQESWAEAEKNAQDRKVSPEDARLSSENQEVQAELSTAEADAKRRAEENASAFEKARNEAAVAEDRYDADPTPENEAAMQEAFDRADALREEGDKIAGELDDIRNRRGGLETGREVANDRGVATNDQGEMEIGVPAGAQAQPSSQADANAQADFEGDAEVAGARENLADAEEKLRKEEARAASSADAADKNPGLAARLASKVRMAKMAVQMARQRVQAAIDGVRQRKNGNSGFGSGSGVIGNGVSGVQDLLDVTNGSGSSGADGKSGGLQRDGNSGIIEPMDPATQARRARLSESIFKQDWVKLLEEPHLEAIKQIFQNATEEELLFWKRHGHLVKGDFYRAGERRYNVPLKEVYFDIREPEQKDLRINQTFAVTSFFHEAGHLFDILAFENTTLHNALGDFDALLAEDYLAYANKKLEDAGKEPLVSLGKMSDAQKWILFLDLDSDPDLNSSIADIVDGLTNGYLGWGRKKDYWKKAKPRMEAVAHMFEARMMKGERLDVIRTYFPRSYKRFDDVFRRLERSGY